MLLRVGRYIFVCAVCLYGLVSFSSGFCLSLIVSDIKFCARVRVQLVVLFVYVAEVWGLMFC